MRYFVIGGLTGNDTDIERFETACKSIGEALRELGHSLIICSPYPDSADYWVFKGFTQCDPKDNCEVEIHFVENSEVYTKLGEMELSSEFSIKDKFPDIKFSNDKGEALKFAWFFCQLQAIKNCQAVIAIGGKPNGAADMLLLHAVDMHKQIIPFPFMGGAARETFQEIEYKLISKLGQDYSILNDENKVRDAIKLSEKMFISTAISDPKFFISYPRKRTYEADIIEIQLLRQKQHVKRDKNDFKSGSNIHEEILRTIKNSNVFIAVHCEEYACSPWCFDELELALDLQESNKMKIWIICLDNTRRIPKRSREMIVKNGRTREEIEKSIMELLNELGL